MTQKSNKGGDVFSDFSNSVAIMVALTREPIADDHKALYISKIVGWLAALDILTSLLSTCLHMFGLNGVGLPLRYSNHYNYHSLNHIIYDVVFYAINCAGAWRIYLGRGYASALLLFILSILGALAFVLVDVASFLHVIISGADLEFVNLMLLFLFGTLSFAMPVAYWGGFKACRYLAKRGYWKKLASP
jgi:hypothetical protein